MTPDEFAELAGLWLTRLRGEGKAPNTITAYASAARIFARWCDDHGQDVLTGRAQAEAWTADCLAAGLDPATAELRCTALRSLSAYLAAQDATDGDVLAGLRGPRRIRKVVPKLAEGEVTALIAACKGTGYAARRDAAMARVLAETGVRSDELLSMDVADVDLKAGTVVIRKAKGNRQRVVPFGGKTAEALGWYLRARRSHPRAAATPALWLSHRGRLSYDGLAKVLGQRAAAAGIEDFTLHRIRHTFASAWLRAGGSEGGLMAIAGWQSREMLDRYTEDTARSRAIEEARRLALGDGV